VGSSPAAKDRRTAMIVDGYVRVSQVRGRGGESFIAPLVQR
jgi:hypothetical protein